VDAVTAAALTMRRARLEPPPCRWERIRENDQDRARYRDHDIVFIEASIILIDRPCDDW
jgi:hypothetical protein